MQSASPPVVAILVFPETTASVVYGMYDLFASAGRDWGVIVEGRPGPELLHPLLVGATGATVVGNGVRIEPHVDLANCPAPAVVCVPEVNVMPGDTLSGRFTREIEWLKHHYQRGATIATACSGAMLLAEAGLLNGHEATTHWAWCDVLRKRYPAVKVREQRALVVSGEGQRLIMAGGGVSWLDLALYLIARHGGVEAAMQVARMNLI